MPGKLDWGSGISNINPYKSIGSVREGQYKSSNVRRVLASEQTEFESGIGGLHRTNYKVNLDAESADFVFQLARSFVTESTLSVYIYASRKTGSFVKFQREYRCLPLLERQDMPPVFLYEFVEAVDGALDFDDVRREFPGLTYSQISGALAFLRRIAQFNTEGVDIDQVEDEGLESDPAFQARIRHGLGDREKTRVLNSQ